MQTEPKHALVPVLGEALYVCCPPLERMSQMKPQPFLPHWVKITIATENGLVNSVIKYGCS